MAKKLFGVDLGGRRMGKFNRSGQFGLTFWMMVPTLFLISLIRLTTTWTFTR